MQMKKERNFLTHVHAICVLFPLNWKVGGLPLGLKSGWSVLICLAFEFDELWFSLLTVVVNILVAHCLPPPQRMAWFGGSVGKRSVV